MVTILLYFSWLFKKILSRSGTTSNEPLQNVTKTPVLPKSLDQLLHLRFRNVLDYFLFYSVMQFLVLVR